MDAESLFTQQVDSDWLNKSDIICAYPDAKVYVLSAASLEKSSPRIATFLLNVSIEPAELNQLILQIEKENAPPAIAAKN